MPRPVPPKLTMLLLLGLGGLAVAGCAMDSQRASEDDYRRAVALTREGRATEAIAVYREAIKANPESAAAYNNLGAVLYDTGQTEAAIPEYRRALALRPNFPEASNNLGVALLSSGRTAEAVGQFRLALETNPHLVAARFNLCLGMEILGQLEEALQQCRQVAQANPAQPGVSAALERLQAKLKDVQSEGETN